MGDFTPFTAGGLNRPLGLTGWKIFPLTLGTAALNQPYAGQPAPPLREVQRLLDTAFSLGVNLVDCSPSYGSEPLVASAIARHPGVRVATKVQATDDIEAVVKESRIRLKRFRPDIVYVQATSLDDQSRAIDRLRELKTRTMVRWIGASVYDQNFATHAIADGVDIVQLPYNVLDRRLEQVVNHDGKTLVDLAKDAGTAIIIRSPWLRGALAGGPAPQHVKDAVKLVRRRLLCRQRRLASVALRYALGAPAASVIIGPRTVAEFTEAANAIDEGRLPFWRRWAIDQIRPDDIDVIDPRTWGADA